MRREDVRVLVAGSGSIGRLRLHPGLLAVKRLLDGGAIGRVLWAYAEGGQYLPDWRPWQDYRKSHTARANTGGGIILDASHEFDYVLWLLGRPIEVLCMAGTVSDCDVDVEDSATMLLRLEGGAQASVHVVFVQRAYARSCKLLRDRDAGVGLSVQRDSALPCRPGLLGTRTYEFEANAMYLDEVDDFRECVEQRRRPRVDLVQARTVLEVALGAKAAALGGAGELA